MSYIKTIKVACKTESDEESTKTIKLQANTFTYILYKALFKSSLQNDLIEFDRKNKEQVKILPNFLKVKNLIENEVEFLNLPTAEREKLYSEGIESFKVIENAEYNTEFLINITAAFIATAEYPIQRDIGEIIADIPIECITAGTAEYNTIISLISELTPTAQKKT